ncbi:Gfo/Idh/MocA family protein [Geosporobacter ferrireducens]|uniref:Gfo/Idh/MocA family protein n=1 Tax=Geosporobacter ferrireducens TaxID=1424294 RepID=UPI00139C8A54|nr:Gfo/Idh/MocA family oxidoreductase [Geosporobacter ferrireducens]MTI54426.1 Gfo/Idh/MocA family oxidoreductase [Geosporobacter ferrireducens]
MRIGIIGLGDIAQKAYLPILMNRGDITPILCTRNEETLERLCTKYRAPASVQSIEALIDQGIEAAFIHTATEAHGDVARELLRQGIHVYIDKPLAYHYEDAQQMIELAEQKNKILRVGFNRRFAPMIMKLKEQESANIIIIQKNRPHLPDQIRRFIFDDFIHVVDTLRYLLPGAVEETQIQGRIENGLLHHVVLTLSGKGYTAIGMMNRDNGTAEEVVEYMHPGNKWMIKDLTQGIRFHQGEEAHFKFGDWEPVLYRRGFYQIIDHFLQSVRSGIISQTDARDVLLTHEICETIVQKLER